MDIRIFNQLLDDFSRVPKSPEHSPTLMEISGYPHLENVCSNILEFFLSPEEEHGLDLFLVESLLASAGISAQPSSMQKLLVTREATTASKARLDIILETNDYVVGIENKILSPIDNPFDDYLAHLVEIAAEREVVPILLSLRPIDEAADFSGFIPVSYENLFAEVKTRIGAIPIDAENHYLIYFNDFIKTLQNLLGGVKVNLELRQFLLKRTGDLNTLFKEMDKVRDELKNKVKELQAALNLEQFLFPVEVDQWIYHPKDKLRLHETLAHDIRISDDLPVFVDTIIWLSGWQHTMHIRKGGDESKFLKWAKESEIELSPIEETGRFQYGEIIPYAEDVAHVSGSLEELLGKIAGSV